MCRLSPLLFSAAVFAPVPLEVAGHADGQWRVVLDKGS